MRAPAARAPLEAIGIPLAALDAVRHARVRIGWLDAPLAAGGAVFVAPWRVVLWSAVARRKPLGAVAVTVFGVLYTGATLSYAYALRSPPLRRWNRRRRRRCCLPVVAHLGKRHRGLLRRACVREAKAHARRESREDGRRRGRRRRSDRWPARGCTYDLVLNRSRSSPWRRGRRSSLASSSVVRRRWATSWSLVQARSRREGQFVILPGAHGGVLDRLDSLYFVLPVAYLILSRCSWRPRVSYAQRAERSDVAICHLHPA